MADYIIRMVPTFAEYEEGEYLEFETEPPSTGHTGYTAAQIRAAMNGSSTTPASQPLAISPGDRFRLWYGHTSPKSGAHTGNVRASSALFSNDPFSIFNGSVEGTYGTWDVFPSTSTWYTVGSTTGNEYIRFQLEYTRGNGDFKAEYLWFNVSTPLVTPTGITHTVQVNGSVNSNFSSYALSFNPSTITVGIGDALELVQGYDIPSGHFPYAANIYGWDVGEWDSTSSSNVPVTRIAQVSSGSDVLTGSMPNSLTRNLTVNFSAAVVQPDTSVTVRDNNSSGTILSSGSQINLPYTASSRNIYISSASNHTTYIISRLQANATWRTVAVSAAGNGTVRNLLIPSIELPGFGETLQYRITAKVPTNYGGSNIEEVIFNFTIFKAHDTDPDNFNTFNGVSGAELSTMYASSTTYTVSGLSTTVTASASGGNFRYRTSGTGSWSAWRTGSQAIGGVANGWQFQVRNVSSASYSSNSSMTLFIGGRSASFTITTRAEDVTPNQFTFTDKTDQPLSTTVQSSSVQILGIDSTASLTASVFGSSGAQIRVYRTSTNSWTGWTSNNISNVRLNDSLQARVTSSSFYNSGTYATVSVGGVSDTFNVNTEVDQYPNAFSLGADVTDANLGTSHTRQFTVSGLGSGVSTTFTAGANTQVSTNNSSWTSSVVRSNNQIVYVKGTASSSYGTTVTCSVSAPGTSDSFNITTRLEDQTPNAFTFAAKSGLEPNSLVYADEEVIIVGMDSTARVSASVNLGEFRYKSDFVFGSWSSWRTGSITGVRNGYAFEIRHTTSPNYSTAVSQTLTVGGTSATFTSTTRAIDNTPTFDLGSATGVQRSTLVQSSIGTISDMDAEASVTASLTGAGEFQVNKGSGWSAYGTADVSGIRNGHQVRVRHTSAANFSSSVSSILSVGNTQDTFTSTTIAAVPPDTTITLTIPTNSLVSTATSFDVSIANGSSVTVYSVRTDSYTGTVVGSRTGNGSITVNDTPTAGTAKTYYLTGHVPDASNGTGVASNIQSFVISKANEGSVDPPIGEDSHGIQVFDSAGNITLSMSDRVAFFKAEGSGTIQQNQSSGFIDLSVPGVTTQDSAFLLNYFTFNASLNATIPADGVVRILYSFVAAGSVDYKFAVVNLGD